MLAKTLELLEFEEIRRILKGYVSSPLGRHSVESLGPFADKASAKAELAAYEQCRSWIEQEGLPVLGLAEDPTPLIERASVEGIVLESTEILVLAKLARVGSDIYWAFRPVSEEFPLLAQKIENLKSFTGFIKKVETTIEPNGSIADLASPALRRIRRSIESQRSRIQSVLQGFLQKDHRVSLQDEFITERNGRWVLPVRSDAHRRVEGVVHGTSSSGATLFIEPLKTVELNNKLFRAQEEEKEEIFRILRALSEEVHQNLQDWRDLREAVANLDLLVSKVRFAQAYDGISPRISDEGELHLTGARHPLLVEQSRTSGETVVPISIHLAGDRQTLILSGPNTGGKTVSLKTIGLLNVMAASGMPITAAESVVPFFDSILIDIGDQQSIQSHLSTFSAHLTSLRQIVENVRGKSSLVLLDELGTGTDPEQGVALAIAVLEHLRSLGTMVVATTHYNRLKTYGYQTYGVANMAVEFDPIALKPTYRLIDGVAGGSSGIEIAARLGLDPGIIEYARSIVDPRELEADRQFEVIRKYINELEETRKAQEIDRQMAKQERLDLRKEYHSCKEKLNDEHRQQLEEIAKTFKLEAYKILLNVRSEVERGRQRKSANRRIDQLKSRTRRVLPQDPATQGPSGKTVLTELRIGDRVQVISWDKEGRVERIDGWRIEVSIAGKRIRVDRNNLGPIAEPTVLDRDSGSREIADGIVVELDGSVDLPHELTIIGCSVEEALQRTDKFLDQAAVTGRSTVRLVHGYGTGKLRKALAGFLADHPHVASYHAEATDAGGQAVTVVDLRS